MNVTINGKPANKNELFHHHFVHCDGGLIEQLKVAGLTGNVNLRTETQEGQGYKGGHETAAKMGWTVSYPAPKKGAVAFLEIERRGRFQGTRPETVSFFIE